MINCFYYFANDTAISIIFSDIIIITFAILLFTYFNQMFMYLLDKLKIVFSHLRCVRLTANESANFEMT